MENASKALIMAGGVLLTMLIIALVIFARSKFSEFYDNEDSLTGISNVSEFNKRFTTYQRDDVHGYELLSLANKVSDYNIRYSNAIGAQNDQQYNKVIVTINFVSKGEREKFTYDGNIRLFTKNTYSNTEIDKFITAAEDTAAKFGGEKTTINLAKNIDSIVLSDAQFAYNLNKGEDRIKSEQSAIGLYNSIVGLSSSLAKTDYNTRQGMDLKSYIQIKNSITGSNNVLGYYEYYQFKKAIFKCDGITYDQNTNRVGTIKFTFTGTIE